MYKDLYSAEIVERIWGAGTGCRQWVPGRRCGNRESPRSKVTSDAGRSNQKICVGRT